MGKAWRVCRAAGEHIGRRGAFLTFLFILDVLVGYSLLFSPSSGLAHVNMLLPLDVWAWVWIGTGVFLTTGIWSRWDRMQYTATVALKAAWGLLYVNLWIEGVPHAWVSAVVWLTFAATIFLVAGWRESYDPLSPPWPGDHQS